MANTKNQNLIGGWERSLVLIKQLIEQRLFEPYLPISNIELIIAIDRDSLSTKLHYEGRITYNTKILARCKTCGKEKQNRFGAQMMGIGTRCKSCHSRHVAYEHRNYNDLGFLKKMHLAPLGLKRNSETCEKIRKWHSGRPLSQAHRAAIKNAMNRPEIRQRISEGMRKNKCAHFSYTPEVQAAGLLTP